MRSSMQHACQMLRPSSVCVHCHGSVCPHINLKAFGSKATHITILGQDGHGVIEAGNEGVSHSAPPVSSSCCWVVQVSGCGGIGNIAITWAATSSSCMCTSNGCAKGLVVTLPLARHAVYIPAKSRLIPSLQPKQIWSGKACAGLMMIRTREHQLSEQGLSNMIEFVVCV